MLDALKDLYISYPFMPVEEAPELFAHVKDIRCVVVLDAMNPISQVENDNYIRAWLTAIDTRSATIEVKCGQYGYRGYVTVPVYTASAGAPATQSYVLIDDALVIPDTAFRYELQPDTLMFLQKAPKLNIEVYGATEAVPITGATIRTDNGYNVSITKGQNGIIIYGAPGVGLGTYSYIPACYTVPFNMQNFGAISINGLNDYVRIDPSYPVDIEADLSQSNIKLVIKNGEVWNETNNG